MKIHEQNVFLYKCFEGDLKTCFCEIFFSGSTDVCSRIFGLLFTTFIILFLFGCLLFRLLKVGRNIAFGVLVFSLPSFNFFSTQNQVIQIIIGQSRIIYHIEATSSVIRTTLQN